MEQEGLTKKQKRELARQEKRKDREKEVRIKKFYKLIIGLVPVLFLLFLGFKFAGWFKTPTTSSSNAEVLGVQSDEWIKGPQEARATLVEYEDFQCPACKDYQPIVNRLLTDFPNDLKIVYRHYPLTLIHTKAYDAAKASEAAGMQGKFWEMHDKLYERQEEWVNDNNYKERFAVYAKDIGLDEEKFKADFESDEVQNKVQEDMSSGNTLGINSTPSFYLNGKKTGTVRSYDDFAKKVNDALGN